MRHESSIDEILVCFVLGKNLIVLYHPRNNHLGRFVDYKFWSLILGLVSILFSQAEQSLRSWLVEFQNGRPVYKGNWLPQAAIVSEKIKAHEKTLRNVIPMLSILRWLSVLLALGSLIFGLSTE